MMIMMMMIKITKDDSSRRCYDVNDNIISHRYTFSTIVFPPALGPEITMAVAFLLTYGIRYDEDVVRL